MVDEQHGNARYTDQDLIAALERLGTASTSEIAGEIGCTRRTAERRLKDLRDRDEIRGETIGNSLIWMSTSE